MARRALDIGFYLLCGIVTFPRRDPGTGRLVPADRLLVETDSPYLAPVPFRGKRNEPAHVARVLEIPADLRGRLSAARRATASDGDGLSGQLSHMAMAERVDTPVAEPVLWVGQPDDIPLSDTAQNSSAR